MKKDAKEKLEEFLNSTFDALLALASLAIDALFWLAWAYVTKWSGEKIGALQIDSKEFWPYTIAQWCGCGVLAAFAVQRTIKDLISLYDSFSEFLEERKASRKRQ